MLFSKSECEILLAHTLHSAVHHAESLDRLFLLFLGAVDCLLHEAALFKASVVVHREVVLKQEASVGCVAELTDDAELLAERIYCNASELLYGVDESASLVLG